MDTFDLIVAIFTIIAVIWQAINQARRDGGIIFENSEAPDIYEQRLIYEARLNMYYEEYKPRLYLKNDFCELKLILNGSRTFVYCKQRIHNLIEGKYFEIKGDADHCNTMWGIFDMVFDEGTTYDDIKRVYRNLNNNVIYFEEKLFDRYPHINNKIAQNEYCRMELKTDKNNRNYILCYDLWGDSPFQFIIEKSEKYSLIQIIREFEKDKNTIMTLSELMWQYEKRGYTIRLIREPANLNTPKIKINANSTTQNKKSGTEIVPLYGMQSLGNLTINTEDTTPHENYTETEPLYGMPVLGSSPKEKYDITQNEKLNSDIKNTENSTTSDDNKQDETKKSKKFKERKLDL